MAHPSVSQAAVIAIPHERWDERPLAAIVLKEGESATETTCGPTSKRLRQILAARRLRIRRVDPDDRDRQVSRS